MDVEDSVIEWKNLWLAAGKAADTALPGCREILSQVIPPGAAGAVITFYPGLGFREIEVKFDDDSSWELQNIESQLSDIHVEDGTKEWTLKKAGKMLAANLTTSNSQWEQKLRNLDDLEHFIDIFVPVDSAQPLSIHDIWS